jgi:regulator of protease activity HflC (stomatin/prohibitin superfamily)
MTQQDNTARNAIIIGASILLSLVIINAVVGPIYNVWAQSLQGKAELQKAEYTRQVAVLEAQAKKDSAQQLADAEVIRASGVAKANQIIGDSLKGNPSYLQYLWITQGEENTSRTVYMVPSNGGAPVPTFDIQQVPSIPKK